MASNSTFLTEESNRIGFLDEVIDENGETELFYAVKRQDANLLKKLLNKGQFDANRVNNEGKTPMDYATEIGRIDMALMLYRVGGKKADELPRQRPVLYDTTRAIVPAPALSRAASPEPARPVEHKRSASPARVQPARGANMHARSSSSLKLPQAPLKQEQIFQMMFSFKPLEEDTQIDRLGRNNLHDVIDENLNMYELTRYLLTKNCNVNLKDVYGVTPIEYYYNFSSKYYPFYISSIRAAGAKSPLMPMEKGYNDGDIFRRPRSHFTMEEWKSKKLNPELFPDYIYPNGDTKLIKAAERGHKEAVHYQITIGSDVNIKDKLGKRAIDYAVLGTDQHAYYMREALLRAGSQPPQKSKDYEVKKYYPDDTSDLKNPVSVDVMDIFEKVEKSQISPDQYQYASLFFQLLENGTSTPEKLLKAYEEAFLKNKNSIPEDFFDSNLFLDKHDWKDAKDMWYVVSEMAKREQFKNSKAIRETRDQLEDLWTSLKEEHEHSYRDDTDDSDSDDSDSDSDDSDSD